MKTDEALELIDLRIDGLEDEARQIHEKLAACRKERQSIIDKALKDDPPDVTTPEGFLSVWSLPGDKPYKMLEKYWESLPPELNAGGGNMTDDDGVPLAPTAQVKLAKNQRVTKKLVDAVHAMAKVVKCNSDDWMYLDIFENTLSEHGVYWSQYYYADGTLEISKTTYGRTETLVPRGDLKTGLQWIADHHWYGSPEEDDD